MLDAEQRLVWTSQDFSALLGSTPEALAGRLLAEVAPGLAARLERPLRETLETERPAHLALPGGGAISCRAIRDDGEPLFIDVVIGHPATAVAAHDAYRQAFADAPGGVALLAPDGTWRDANRALCELLGLPRDQVVAEGLLGSVHPADARTARAAWRDALRAASDTSFEHRIVRPDGDTRTVAVTTRPARAAQGEPSGIVCHVQDVSERQQVLDGLRRREAESRAQADEHAALQRLTMAIATDVDPSDLFVMVAAQVAHLLGAPCGAVLRFEGEERAVVVGAYGGSEPWPSASVDLEGSGVAAAVFRAAGAVRVEDPGDRRVPGLSRYNVAAPVRLAGRAWGAIVASSSRPLPPEAERRLSGFSDLIGLAVANADARAQLAARATQDPLTGLANHRVFHERLLLEFKRARRHERPLALAVLDLDHFKRVNDSFGHRTGDEALVEVARRLTSLARAGEVLGRVGGEEFAWILPETDARGACAAAERARAAISTVPFGRAGHMTLSVGVADLTQASSAEELFALADEALYHAKMHGRDACVAYSPERASSLRPADRAARLAAEQVDGLAALCRAVASRSPERQRHSERVAERAARLARELAWPQDEVEALREAALLHEVGVLALSDEHLASGDEAASAAAHRIDLAASLLRPDQVVWLRGMVGDGEAEPDGEAVDGAAVLRAAHELDHLDQAGMPPGAAAEQLAVRLPEALAGAVRRSA